VFAAVGVVGGFAGVIAGELDAIFVELVAQATPVPVRVLRVKTFESVSAKAGRAALQVIPNSTPVKMPVWEKRTTNDIAEIQSWGHETTRHPKVSRTRT